MDDMKESSSVLHIQNVGAVRILMMSTGPKVNPLSIAVQKELLQAMSDVRSDPSVRAVVITSAGRTFCVGADLSTMGPAGAPGSTNSTGNQTGDTIEILTNRVVLAINNLPVPVLCAVNGVAAGAGVGLALAGDVVVAARSAYFQVPFMNRLGIVPDMGASWFLQRTLGRQRATALTLLGDRLDAEKALEWGLVWAIYEDAVLQQEVLGIAQRLASLPTYAIAETRALYRSAAESSLPSQLDYEARRQRELVDGPAFAEGVRSFLEKRDPVFPPRA